MKGKGRTIIKIALIALAVIVLGLIQAGFFDRLKIFNCKPELVLCFLIVLSARLDMLYAGLAGFAGGLYVDIVYGRYVGLYALLYLLSCWLASVLFKKLMEKQQFLGMVILPPLFLAYEMLQSLIIRFIAVYSAGEGALYEYGYGTHFAARILPCAAYNLLVSVIFYLIMLLIMHIRRPKPDINYKREKDYVIDNA